jgi:hypothetical protein
MKVATLALPLLVAFGSAAFAAEGASGDASIPAACNPDMQKYCASATTDEAKIDCLAQNESKLGQACRTAINNSGNPEEQPHSY